MKTVKVTIEGVTPLILNKFTDQAQMQATKGTRLSGYGDKGAPKDIAESKLYKNDNGQAVVPQPNLLRCLIDAGKFFKAGKSKVTTVKSSLIPSCVDIEGVDVVIDSKKGWSVDTRPVRIPATGGRILTHRPIFNDWSMTFTATVDTEMMTPGLFREIVDAAGKRIGLGDFRPDCKGPYGKFVVTEWKEAA